MPYVTLMSKSIQEFALFLLFVIAIENIEQIKKPLFGAAFLLECCLLLQTDRLVVVEVEFRPELVHSEAAGCDQNEKAGGRNRLAVDKHAGREEQAVNHDGAQYHAEDALGQRIRHGVLVDLVAFLVGFLDDFVPAGTAWADVTVEGPQCLGVGRRGSVSQDHPDGGGNSHVDEVRQESVFLEELGFPEDESRGDYKGERHSRDLAPGVDAPPEPS